ncbi:MAG: leucine--tRNA ligase [bacterium]
MLYTHSVIESKWQKRWKESAVFRYIGVKSGKPKYYMLEMFPYPSGKLHMGHVRNYSIGDVVSRYYFRKGFDVLHPMGWDAFGLPAENAAIENKIPPAKWTYSNIESMRERFRQLGFSYDWDREIATCSPDYYKWEQLFFIEMFNKGLAYKKNSEVNWCPLCNTVLANEQVEDGTCWRHNAPVEKKKIEQWYFKTTEYAEELLNSLDTLHGWSEHVKEMQKNWIGKSTGTYINFELEGRDKTLTVFTTRPDTLMGVTFASIAVEHEMAQFFIEQSKEPEKMKAFVDEVKKLHLEIKDDNYEKKGFFTGFNLIHPIDGRKIPLYFANFVLADYGTGVVMAVPAHDERDFEFAKKYKLPVKIVISPEGEKLPTPLEAAYTEPGVMVNSQMFDGLSSEEGKKAVSDYLINAKKGEIGINYRLRDWGISRQRYWGTPIPIIYCDKCGVLPEKKENLPVKLPENVEFSGASSPLKDMKEFYETTCPLCGEKAKRETDTMDTFVESAWYHMKFCDPFSKDVPFSKTEVNHAMPVDQYIGGVEHAVMHLLYTRFFTKILADFGYVSFREPVKNLLTQGMVCMETYHDDTDYLYPEEVYLKDGEYFKKSDNTKINVGRVEKMSKSKKNVVDPIKLIEKYGADATRLFVLFAAPPEKDLEWSEDGVEGCNRFLLRVWNIVSSNINLIKNSKTPENVEGEAKELWHKTHATIKKVTDDIERFHFNTAISAIMELTNSCYKFKAGNEQENDLFGEALKAVVQLLNPFAPHITEELAKMCEMEELAKFPFPLPNKQALIKDEILVVVQINGKLRDRLTFSANATKEEVEKAVRARDYSKYLNSKEIKKIIYVPGKLVNIVG